MSQLFRVIMWVGMVIGAAAVVFLTASSALTTPAQSAVGVILGAIYTAVVIWLLRRHRAWPLAPQRLSGNQLGQQRLEQQRLEQQRLGGNQRGATPRGFGLRSQVHWVAAALLWGAGVSTLIAFATGPALMLLISDSGWHASMASWGGAYPEEIGKALGVVVVVMSFRFFNRPWHGLIVGAVVGLGFEANENVLYGSMGALLDPESDWMGFWETWALRLVAGPALHVTFTALAGWGIGWALFAFGWSMLRRLATALGWLVVAFSLHFAWNYLIESSMWFMVKNVVVCLVMYPLLAWALIRAHRLALADTTYVYTPGALTAPDAADSPAAAVPASAPGNAN